MSYYNEDAYKAANKYKKENIKRVPLDMQKSKYEEVKAAADAAGEKVNEYIKKAIEQRMEREHTGGVVSIFEDVENPVD